MRNEFKLHKKGLHDSDVGAENGSSKMIIECICNTQIEKLIPCGEKQRLLCTRKQNEDRDLKYKHANHSSFVTDKYCVKSIWLLCAKVDPDAKRHLYLLLWTCDQAQMSPFSFADSLPHSLLSSSSVSEPVFFSKLISPSCFPPVRH